MYQLRWKFEFTGSKPTKVGHWDAPYSQDPSRMAAFVNKENLSRAVIEGKTQDGQIQTIVQCEGWDFINFEWVMEMRSNDEGIVYNLLGLKLVTRDEQLWVLFTGDVRVEPRTDADKNFHYEGFGR